MMDPKERELAERLDSLRAEMAELDAVEEPTDEQVQRMAAAIDEYDAAKAEYDPLHERNARIRAALKDPKTQRVSAFDGGSPQVMKRTDPFEGLDLYRASGAEVLDRARSAVEHVRYAGPFHVRDTHRDAVMRLLEGGPDGVEVNDADSVARHILATGSPEYMSAFRAWLSSGGAPIYSREEAEAVRASMSLTSANGGYVLPFLLDPTLIHTGAATKNPIRRLARKVTGTQNSWHGVTVANVTTAWKGEGSAFTDGSPTTGGITVTAAALTAYVTASYELFQDSNMQAQLPGLIAESIDYAEGTAFVSGSGSTAPKGIVTAISATVASTVTATTRASFTSASAVDTLALLNSVAPRYEDSVTWVANKATFNTIRQQTFGTAGTLVFDMAMGQQLLGSPIAASSDMVSATTSGNVLVVLGDFSQFVVYDRIGTSLEFIPNVVDGSGIPTGQRGLVAYKRVGSDCSDINAFRFLKA